MSEPDEPTLTLTTNVGRALFGDNHFFGASVRDELAGNTSLWDICSMSVGGPRIDAESAAILDAITTSGLAADPRLWPPKISRLGSTYGRTVAGISAALLALDRSHIGPQCTGTSAQSLIELRDGVERGTPLIEQLEARLASGQRIPGFGIPVRKEDERVIALRPCISRSPAAGRPYWRLVNEADLYLSQRTLPLNITGATAALLLDMGFSPQQCADIGIIVLLPCFFANAAESAEQRAAIMQSLPDVALHYVGPPARRSPRAIAADPDPADPER